MENGWTRKWKTNGSCFPSRDSTVRAFVLGIDCATAIPYPKPQVGLEGIKFMSIQAAGLP